MTHSTTVIRLECVVLPWCIWLPLVHCSLLLLGQNLGRPFLHNVPNALPPTLLLPASTPFSSPATFCLTLNKLTVYDARVLKLPVFQLHHLPCPAYQMLYTTK
jgi:hypothetical protein